MIQTICAVFKTDDNFCIVLNEWDLTYESLVLCNLKVWHCKNKTSINPQSSANSIQPTSLGTILITDFQRDCFYKIFPYIFHVFQKVILFMMQSIQLSLATVLYNRKQQYSAPIYIIQILVRNVQYDCSNNNVCICGS